MKAKGFTVIELLVSGLIVLFVAGVIVFTLYIKWSSKSNENITEKVPSICQCEDAGNYIEYCKCKDMTCVKYHGNISCVKAQ